MSAACEYGTVRWLLFVDEFDPHEPFFSYDEYRRNVPPLLPRLRPWEQPDRDGAA